MKKLLLISLSLVLISGCKSIKKVKSIQSASQIEVVEKMSEETVLKSSVQQEQETRIVYEEEQETTTTSYDVIETESGDIVKVPTSTTTRIKRKYKEDSSSELSSQQKEQKELVTNNSQSSSSDNQLELDKSSEGMNVIADAADALFPTWGKILVTIITALAGVGWKIYQNKKGSS